MAASKEELSPPDRITPKQLQHDARNESQHQNSTACTSGTKANQGTPVRRIAPENTLWSNPLPASHINTTDAKPRPSYIMVKP